MFIIYINHYIRYRVYLLLHPYRPFSTCSFELLASYFQPVSNIFLSYKSTNGIFSRLFSVEANKTFVYFFSFMSRQGAACNWPLLFQSPSSPFHSSPSPSLPSRNRRGDRTRRGSEIYSPGRRSPIPSPNPTRRNPTHPVLVACANVGARPATPRRAR